MGFSPRYVGWMAHRRTPPYNTPVSPRSTCMPFSACALCLSLSVSPSLFIRFLASHGCEECRGRDCGCSCNRATLCRIFQADSRGRPGTSLFPGVQNTMQSKTCLIFRQERLLSLSLSLFFYFLFVCSRIGKRNAHHAPRFRYNEERNGETNLGGFSIKGNGCFLGNVRFILAGNGDRMDRGILIWNQMVWYEL